MRYIKEIFTFFEKKEDKFIKKLIKKYKNSPEEFEIDINDNTFIYNNINFKIENDHLIFKNKKIQSEYIKDLSEILFSKKNNLKKLRLKKDFFEFLKNFFDEEKYRTTYNENYDSINSSSRTFGDNDWQLTANLNNKKIYLTKSYPTYKDFKEYEGRMTSQEYNFFKKMKDELLSKQSLRKNKDKKFKMLHENFDSLENNVQDILIEIHEYLKNDNRLLTFKDAPTKPIGNGNPYHMCEYCGKPEPQWHDGHYSDCKWMEMKKNFEMLKTQLPKDVQDHLLEYLNEIDYS